MTPLSAQIFTYQLTRGVVARNVPGLNLCPQLPADPIPQPSGLVARYTFNFFWFSNRAIKEARLYVIC